MATSAETQGKHEAFHQERPGEEDDNGPEDSAGPRKQRTNAGAATAGKKKKKGLKKRGTGAEPSLKWRALGLSPDDITIPSVQRNTRTGNIKVRY